MELGNQRNMNEIKTQQRLIDAAVKTRRYRIPRWTTSCITPRNRIGARAAYSGGSKIAIGSAHIVLKSLVRPPTVYRSRGVDATEIIPQHASKRNLARSRMCQSV
jgi:hypothetical protein